MINPVIKISQWLYNCLERAASIVLMRPKGKNIAKKRKIVYGNTGKSVCDYIYPAKVTAKLPIMVYIHGGGWVSGFRSVRNYYCYEYADKGFFVVNVDYDYATSQTHPFQINQILSLIDKLYDKQKELNIDFEKLVIAGDSAGAYLASMLAAVVNCTAIKDIDPNIKHLGKYKVKALLSMCGAFNLSELYTNEFPQMKLFLSCYTGIDKKSLPSIVDIKDYDLRSIINSNFPRTFIIKALNDKLLVESDNLEQMLIANKVQFDSYIATGVISFHCFPLMCRTTVGRDCLQQSVETIKKFVNL